MRGRALLLSILLAGTAPFVIAAAADAKGTSATSITKATRDMGLAFISRHQGVWRGTFRRYDADGKLTAELPSEIITRVIVEGDEVRFHQTNRLRKPDGSEEVIDSHGDIRDGRVWFANPRVEGWSMPVAGDPNGRAGVLLLAFKDGSGLYMHEIVSLSDDARFRSRVAQYLKDGRLIRRTLIDEEKVSDDWAAEDARRKR